MGELINGKTAEEIKASIRCCHHVCTEKCSYYKTGIKISECTTPMSRDALALIEHLEAERDAALAKVPKWISVEERLPENEGDYLVRKVHSYSDKDGYSQIDVCIYCKMRDPEWIGCGNLCKVTHWMPLPESPKEG